jgi:two-component system, chemotaxis family, protein-glutamate methylesterase/glutaminase
VLSIILTGMGNDGQKGVAVLKNKGAYCLTQSRETCVVYGMPRAVDEAGLSDESVPLQELGMRINQLVGGGHR